MPAALKPMPNAVLLLADGTVFFGHGIGAQGTTAGELCFNTAMTGYQEILTDPSYMGQIVTFTFPHVGNVGCNAEDVESVTSKRENSVENAPLGACGLILREAITEPSNFRAAQSLNDWLIARGITGISGIDTRALTRHLRDRGAQNGTIVVASRQSSVVSKEGLVKKARSALQAAPDMNGLELAAHATTKENYPWEQPRWELGAGYPQTSEGSRVGGAEPRSGGVSAAGAKGGKPPSLPLVVAIDYGVKLNILRSLASVGCRITVVPATITAEEVLALNPDGIFLSNGPGDPSATGNYAVPVIKKLVDSGLPIFGICLGHQLLGIALGARTEKMRQGHRGANHPVKDMQTGKVEITSQNHGFAIADTGLPAELEVTHRSLFDGTIQGIRHRTLPIFSVQGHPEASPGPHDSRYLFAQFVEMIAHTEKKVA